MFTLEPVLVPEIGMVLDHASSLVSSLFNDGGFVLLGGGVKLAMAIGPAQFDDPIEAYLSRARKWHGNIDEQFQNIKDLHDVLANAKPAWDVPTGLVPELKGHITSLQTLIDKCNGASATQRDRTDRNSELKTTVSLCIVQIKFWAYGAYALGHLTTDDIHSMGFLLPGERGGHRARAEANVVQAEVKASVLSASSVRIVVDQAADKNAGQVAHGWPTGIKHVLIAITTDNGKTEVYRGITSRLHNKIDIPEGFAGKMFIVKAAFLKHTNDKPEFLAETTFTMPFTFDDLAKMIEQQHEADLEEHRLEVERLVEENRVLKMGVKS
jgi:hypothetical protein